MRRAPRPKIHFDSLDKRLLYLVCDDSPSCQDLIAHLGGSGYTVKWLQNFNELYGCLESGQLGYVLLSRELQEAFGEAHLAGFIQRRFHVPIMSFSLKPPTPNAEEGKAMQGSPEIVHLPGGISASDLMVTVSSFENDYHKEGAPAKEADAKDAAKETVTGGASAKSAATSRYDSLALNLKAMMKQAPLQLTPDHPMKMLGLRVKAGEDRFIILCGVPLPVSDADEKELKETMINSLAGLFPNAQISESQIFDSVTRIEHDRLSEGARNRWEGNVGPSPCVISLIAENVTEKELTEHPQGFCIPLEDWLTKSNLAFPVYHWLELNQKKIRYVKPGRKIDSKSIERFTKRGVAYLLIQEDDLDTYEIFRQLVSSRAS